MDVMGLMTCILIVLGFSLLLAFVALRLRPVVLCIGCCFGFWFGFVGFDVVLAICLFCLGFGFARLVGVVDLLSICLLRGVGQLVATWVLFACVRVPGL